MDPLLVDQGAQVRELGRRTKRDMTRLSRLVVAVVFAALLAAGCGSASDSGSASHPTTTKQTHVTWRSYQDARQVMIRAGFDITTAEPRLAASWPAVFRDHCTAMLMGFYHDTAADTAQTWVCKSDADAHTLRARLASGPPHTIILASGSKQGADRFSVRQNLVFFVLAENQAAADHMTRALRRA